MRTVTNNIFEELKLDSGIRILLSDETCHYFGGYYHVKVLARSDVALEKSYFNDEQQYMDALLKLGQSVRFERVLEKMAVPESEVEPVRNQLVAAFKSTSVSYLSAPDFERRLVRNEYRKLLTKSGKKFPSAVF